MTRHQPNSQYPNVNEVGDVQGLIWDGHHGEAYEPSNVEPVVDRAVWDARDARQYEHLFDHVIRFKPRGPGRRDPVMAISAPYLHDDDALRERVLAFCSRFGLAARVGDERYRVYSVDRTVTIVFWRPDLVLLR